MGQISTQIVWPLAHRLLAHAPATFAVSTGRTGTATLVELLQCSPSLAAYHEPAPTCMAEAKRAYLDRGEPQHKYLRIFKKARAGYLLRARITGKLHVEATNMIYFAPLIAEHFPKAKFIFLHRCPGGVVRSGMRRGWYAGHPNDRNRITPREDDPARGRWPSWGPFEKNCWFWHAVNEFILDFRESINPERVFTLSFDDLTSANLTPKEQLFTFLGVEAPRSAAIRTALHANRNAQERGRFPKFADWSTKQKECLYRIAGDTMDRLGYA